MTSSPAPRLPRLLSFFVLALLGWLLYGVPALRAQHLNFDDPFFFGPQSAFAGGGLAQVLDPTRTIANAYLPVAHASLYLDWLLGGSDCPALPRLHSLLLHVVVAFALARLLGRLGFSVAVATAAAALFLVHPALVESVAWSSSRKDLLSGLGVLLSLSACVEHARAPSRGRLLAVAGWAVFALYAKATAVVVAPLALLLVAFVRERQPGAWRAVLLLLLLAALAGAHHAWLAAREGTLAGGADALLAERAVRVPGATLHYLGKLVWPAGLNVLYPEVLTLEAFAARVAPAAIALALVLGSAGAALAFPRTRVAGVAAAAVLVALVPFNTALPASAIAAADRYLYLVVPWGALAVAALAGRAALPVCGALALAAVLVALGRVGAFADSGTLWRASLAQEPRNAVACLNLATVVTDRAETRRLLEQAAECARYPQHAMRAESALASIAWQDDRREAAVRHAQRAVAAAQTLPAGEAARHERVRLSLRGAVMAQTAGDGDVARQLAADALALAPEHPAVLAYRASVLLRAAVGADGRLRADAAATRAEAFALLDAAERADPAAADPFVVRGQWLAAAGENLPAIKAFDDALARAPQHADAHGGKVDLLLGQSLFAAAEAAARRAIAAQIDDANLLAKLGMALAGQHKLADARGFYEDYLRLRPADAGVRRLLAAVLVLEARPLLFQLGPEQLEPRAARIRDLEPQNPEATVLLAMARRHQRRLREALVLLEGARTALPQDEDVVRLLAETHRDLGYQIMLAGGERDRAIDHLVQFCALAPSDVATDAARMVLEEECTRQENAGVDAFGKKELDVAERHFRRCLAIVPDRAWTRYQLGLTLLQRGGDATAVALVELRAAETGLRALKHDASTAVLYQIIALRQLGQAEEAVAKARAFLAAEENRGGAAFDRIRELVK